MKLLYYLIILICLLNPLFCFSEDLFNSEKMVNTFLQNNFGKKIKHASKVVNINKNDFFKFLLETSDSATAKEKIKLLWPHGFKTFIDSVYFFEKMPPSNGFFIKFYGDTASYVSGFYKEGKRDSIWKSKGYEFIEIESYKKGKSNGDHIGWYPNGQMAFRKKWYMNQILDTVFNWYPNGNIKEFEVWEKGESVQHECFNEKGDPIECESD